MLFEDIFNQVSFEKRLSKSSFKNKLAQINLKYLTLLDAGSTVHLFMNRELVSNIVGSIQPLFLGTNGRINVTKSKTMNDDVDAWFNPKAMKNALSCGLLTE